jgi:photosystem II stability/assembly factor-like uncharacterized protein
MRCLNSFLAIVSFLLIVIVTGCAPRSGPSPSKSSWKFVGLNNIVVNRLNLFNRTIYAATQDGMYIYKNGHFKQAGLKNKNVIDIVLIKKNEWLAAVLLDSYSQKNTLFKTINGGATWHPHMGNYGGKKNVAEISELAIHPKDKNILFACGYGNVSRSRDGGQTWKSIFLTWDAVGGCNSFLKVDPLHPDIIWAGGLSATGYPSLIKSMDGGNNWLHLRQQISVNTKSRVASIDFNLSNTKVILAGMVSPTLSGDIIRKTTNSGKTWHMVLDSIKTLTLANSARNPMTIYASGAKPDPSQLFFSVSPDFGETWKMVIWKDSPPPSIHVNDMVSVMQNGHEVLYFGTNKGVYSYTFAK